MSIFKMIAGSDQGWRKNVILNSFKNRSELNRNDMIEVDERAGVYE